MHRPSALEEEITWGFVVSLNFQSGSVLLSPAVDLRITMTETEEKQCWTHFLFMFLLGLGNRQK